MKIKDLKSPYRELATKYAYDDGWADEYIRTGLELSDAFDWEDTFEGYDFWYDVDSYIYSDIPQSLELETPEQDNNTITEVLNEIKTLMDKKLWIDNPDYPSIEGKDILLTAIGELLKKYI